MGVQSELNARTLRAIKINSRWLKRPIGFLHREDEPLSPAMRAFTEILRTVCTSGDISATTRPRRRLELSRVRRHADHIEHHFRIWRFRGS